MQLKSTTSTANKIKIPKTNKENVSSVRTTTMIKQSTTRIPDSNISDKKEELQSKGNYNNNMQ